MWPGSTVGSFSGEAGEQKMILAGDLRGGEFDWGTLCAYVEMSKGNPFV
jgi:hypothetical protein